MRFNNALTGHRLLGCNILTKVAQFCFTRHFFTDTLSLICNVVTHITGYSAKTHSSIVAFFALAVTDSGPEDQNSRITYYLQNIVNHRSVTEFHSTEAARSVTSVEPGRPGLCALRRPRSARRTRLSVADSELVADNVALDVDRMLIMPAVLAVAKLIYTHKKLDYCKSNLCQRN